MSEALFLGLDAGTGGVRTVVASESGEVLAAGEAALDPSATVQASGRHEQDADAWWLAARNAIQLSLDGLAAGGHSPAAIQGLAVDGTSGTIVAVDDRLRPLGHALMYNDGRADEQATELNERAAGFCDKLGYRFAASFALAKILWIRQEEPERFAKTHKFLHQADYLAARLTGKFVDTDYSNALKTGYDLVKERWPDWIGDDEQLRRRLPDVGPPGSPIGNLPNQIAAELGLPPGTTVVAGATDGTAAFLASGASRVGDDNTTLGTTLVFKRVAETLAKHPQGLIYSHKLPGGMWLPGAASNTGGDWIRKNHPDADLVRLDRQAARHLPVQHVCYPLSVRGERFPFLAPDAAGFCVPASDDAAVRFAAGLQGVALLERLGYEVLDAATGNPARGHVYATGAASRSDVWLQCRADVCGRAVQRPQHADSAFGSAILAAAGTASDGIWEAARRMVHIDATFRPNENNRERYDNLYSTFKNLLAERGYLTS